VDHRIKSKLGKTPVKWEGGCSHLCQQPCISFTDIKDNNSIHQSSLNLIYSQSFSTLLCSPHLSSPSPYPLERTLAVTLDVANLIYFHFTQTILHFLGDVGHSNTHVRVDGNSPLSVSSGWEVDDDEGERCVAWCGEGGKCCDVSTGRERKDVVRCPQREREGEML
jgi:hypothetical protein